MELQCLQCCFSLHCVRGCYPSALLEAWDKFDQEKGSENDRPGKTIFPENAHIRKCHMLKFQHKCSGEYLVSEFLGYVCVQISSVRSSDF